MGFFPELDELTATELMAAFGSDERIFRDVPPEERELWLQEVGYKIAREAGERGLDFLMQSAAGADAARLRGILLGVSAGAGDWLARRREKVKEFLLGFLTDPQPSVTAEAIDALRALGFHEAANQLTPLLAHESPYVVGAVLRFLSWHDPEAARPVLVGKLGSPEPIIRENAVDELDDIACVEALPQLRRLLNDEDADVRQAATAAVRHLEALQAQQ